MFNVSTSLLRITKVLRHEISTFFRSDFSVLSDLFDAVRSLNVRPDLGGMGIDRGYKLKDLSEFKVLNVKTGPL